MGKRIVLIGVVALFGIVMVGFGAKSMMSKSAATSQPIIASAAGMLPYELHLQANMKNMPAGDVKDPY